MEQRRSAVSLKQAAHWAARHLQAHPDHRVLVTFFNRGLASMLERLLRLAAERRAGAVAGRADALLRRATVLHADEAVQQPGESFDAVFVDEAQDFDAALLSRVWAGHFTDSRGPKPAVVVGLLIATAADDAEMVARANDCKSALGASVLANALMTDYPLGVFRLYSFKVHGILDYGVAAASAAFPEMLRLRRTSAPAQYFYGQGAGETMIAGITNYDDERGSRFDRWRVQRELDRRRAA